MFLILIGIGIFITSENGNQLPEDKNLSSGNSAVRGRMETIDNSANVEGYDYDLEGDRKSKNFRLKDMKYTFWEEISFPMEQYLQGICFSEQYVFVSAYLDEVDSLGEIMVFHRESGEYMITFGLDEESHLGGIAFDGEHIWVCNSTNQTIERISYKALCRMIAQHKGEKVNITNLVEVYQVENSPSCIAYYDGLLWVATHNKWINSIMATYAYDTEKDMLLKKGNYKIPARVQGIGFDEDGGVYLSCSYGRRNSSYLKKYASVTDMSQDTRNQEWMIEMPPCSEGIALWEDRMYILFESAGEKYYAGTDGYGTSLSPLDKILILDLKILR